MNSHFVNVRNIELYENIFYQGHQKNIFLGEAPKISALQISKFCPCSPKIFRCSASHYPTTLLFFLGEIKGNRASKLKKGLFNVEWLPKDMFWGETYFLDFYIVTHSHWIRNRIHHVMSRHVKSFLIMSCHFMLS